MSRLGAYEAGEDTRPSGHLRLVAFRHRFGGAGKRVTLFFEF